jgi:organic radical activating enzyme
VKHYRINEVFTSLQGEGMRAGTANVFVRFTGCNLRCTQEPGPKSPGGFDCDTEFESGTAMTLDELYHHIQEVCVPVQRWLVLTGGEPGLQVDDEFIAYWKRHGFSLAIETNGSVPLPDGLDWITVSPKVAEHAIRQRIADEVKYVRGHGQAIPRTQVTADYRLISPAFNGLDIDRKALAWCVRLVTENPEWRLTVQQHKAWSVR